MTARRHSITARRNRPTRSPPSADNAPSRILLHWRKPARTATEGCPEFPRRPALTCRPSERRAAAGRAFFAAKRGARAAGEARED
jgi:hypothetical protein